MSSETDEIKDLLEEDEKKEEEGKEKVDEEALDKIVDRMSEKYKKEGILKEEEAPDKVKELRKLMRGERSYNVGEASAKQLSTFDNPLVRFFGKLYKFLEVPVNKIEEPLERKLGKNLEQKLNAARMEYSAEQYLTLSIISTGLATIGVFALFLILALMELVPMILPVIGAIATAPAVIGISLLIPRSKANSVGNEIEKELPFALRHMSIQIRAGVGVYETMQSIADSDYGRLSEGFQWVLDNIEKGVSTEDALEAWAERTESPNVRRVVSHIVRALRTGGNLSNVMVEIAEDVSFQRRQKIADFSEKLNLVGLFLMMSAIVLPIMIAILSTIGAAPQIQKYLGFFSVFSQTFLLLVFFIVVPALLGVFMYYIKSSDPGAI